MSQISRAATFSADDTPERIRQELACPCCGHQDFGSAHLRITDNSLRIFCTGCGAFITITLSDEQAGAIRRCSSVLSTISAPPS